MRIDRLETPTIAAMNNEKKNFFILDYQRGYRWTATEVRALLDDIMEFGEKELSGPLLDNWYCLQPVVTKRIPKDIAEGYGLDPTVVWYEVIDGQQRLTTIFLISRFINKAWRGTDPDPEPVIRYQTRPDSADFLASLVLDQPESPMVKSNIDFHHIWSAFQTIRTWASELPKGDSKRNKDTFISKFLNNTRVIWYETQESDSIDVFTRLNLYKIPLTNSELVKALLLSRRSVQTEQSLSDYSVRLRQFEIASEWDRIEATLQNPEFWCFITDPKLNQYSTRIELLFDLMSDKRPDSDDFHTFNFFRNRLATLEAKSELVWKEIKTTFLRIESWFNHREYYHKIGYLIWAGSSLKSLLDRAEQCSTKTEFSHYLLDTIKATLKNVDIASLRYDSNLKSLWMVLLLHNIETLHRCADDTARFPFDRFKNEDGWDVEHIHALADGAPTVPDAMREWLMETKNFLGMDRADLSQKMNLMAANNDLTDQHFRPVYDEVLSYFRKQGDDENSLSNLVLLDSKTNRSYKAAVFPVKRHKIIQRIKAGSFVPICTRNVFLKFYNEDVSQLYFWGASDREAYQHNIAEVLNQYLPPKVETGTPHD